MEDDNQPICPELIELLGYLHNQDLYLPPDFNEHLIPMMRGLEFTAVDEYVCQVSDKGVLDRAKWISKGFGYAVCITKGPNGEDIEILSRIFRPGLIMLDEHGFFNDVPTDLIYRLAKGTTAIPFSKYDFATLAVNVPEAQLLATKIISAQHTENEKINNMLRMKGQAKIDAFEEIFSKEVYQYFDRQDLARYLGFTPEHFSRL